MATGQIAASARAVAELAQSRGVRECLHWFTREKQWINEQHLAVCRIPAPTFLEQKRAEWIAEQFRALGWHAAIDPAGNVVALPDRYSDRPLVALTAHLDTVLAPRKPEEIAVDGDGKFRGPGVADNGSGLAALLAIACALKACPRIEGAAAELALIANVGEEGEGNLSGMRYLCTGSELAERVRVFLVLDGPATDHITCQALACRRYEVLFSGPGGHSWSDYGTANPVHALSRSIAVFTENCPNGTADGARSSFNFGTIEGGSSVNSIPALARAKLDLRSERDDKLDGMFEHLSSAVERALEFENQRATGGKLTAKLKEIGTRPAGQLPPDASILAFLRAVDAHLGIRARLDCSSTDANIPLSLGRPAVSVGAGGQGGGAHTPSEWFHPEGRDLGLKRIFLALCLLLREP